MLRLLLVFFGNISFLTSALGQAIIVNEQEVTFYNGQLKIAGTLFVPKLDKKIPAIAVTHGSGKEGRKSPGHRSFASQLAKEGYVVLIYDKRGVGDSEGEYVETPDMSVPAGDLVEAVRFLKSKKEVDAANIGVYGHSQGGWVAPLAATFCRDIHFVIVSCGGAVSIREQVLYNRSTELKKQGVPDSIVEQITAFGTKLYSYLGSGEGFNVLNAEYNEAKNQDWFNFYKQMGFGDQLPAPSFLSNSSFNFFKMLNYDPQSTLRFLDVPVFVVLAEKDEIIPTPTCKRKWEECLKASGHQSLLTIMIIHDEVHAAWERNRNDIVYKSSFAQAIIKWLKEKQSLVR